MNLSVSVGVSCKLQKGSLRQLFTVIMQPCSTQPNPKSSQSHREFRIEDGKQDYEKRILKSEPVECRGAEHNRKTISM